jgi:hypothetical protein
LESEPLLLAESAWNTVPPRSSSCEPAGAMDYHLKPVGTTCAHGGERLEPNTVCVSVLVERDGELMRLDYCEADWPGTPEGAIGLWRCRVPEPEIPANRPLDPDGLMRYFEQLGEGLGNLPGGQLAEDADPLQQKLRYVLALLLLQKRRLKLDGSRMEGEREVLEFTGARGEGQFEVPDCKLADEEIEGLQDQLNEQMQYEWS